jgi:hypothetical protein
MSFATTFITLLSLASTALALPVPAAHQNEKRYSGVRMTYYDTSVGLGACGNLNQNSAWTVALNSAQFGGGYPSPECGKTITISYGGKTAQAVIQDACPSCPYGGLDLSPSLFQHFAVSLPETNVFDDVWCRSLMISLLLALDRTSAPVSFPAIGTTAVVLLHLLPLLLRLRPLG